MCLGGGGSQAAPAPAPVPAATPAPTRQAVRAGAAAGKVETVKEAAKKVRRRQGIFGNIRTTPAGDPLYGANVGSLATFGSA